MINKPFFWLIAAAINLIFWAVGLWGDVPMAFRYHCEYLFWFALGVCSVLVKLNQLGERIENAQRLQTTAFRTLKKDK